MLECAGAGYAAQGNEFSYFMLLTANYILNQYVHFQWIDVEPCARHLTG